MRQITWFNSQEKLVKRHIEDLRAYCPKLYILWLKPTSYISAMHVHAHWVDKAYGGVVVLLAVPASCDPYVSAYERLQFYHLQVMLREQLYTFYLKPYMQPILGDNLYIGINNSVIKNYLIYISCEELTLFVIILTFNDTEKSILFSVYFLLFPYPKNFSQFFSSHWKK